MVSKKVAKKEVKKAVVKEENASKGDVESGKTLAVVSYLWIAGFIILFTEKKNKFVMFHAKQAAALAVVELIPVVNFVAAIAGLYGIITALQGKQVRIPLMYEFGEWIYKTLNPQ
ncbi:Uncharacterised protein [Candidatus Tiddalikarchaeum anstoanum]|nr:Uncharacterised protein [Candidatus Tiddalikarchaeum anstoanum]